MFWLFIIPSDDYLLNDLRQGKLKTYNDDSCPERIEPMVTRCLVDENRVHWMANAHSITKIPLRT
jgi:hypothetical protein